MKNYFVAAFCAFSALSAGANSPFISEVFDYVPAPGQFIHLIPEVADDMSREQVLEAAARQLVGDERPGMVSLGAFGGYIVFGFDHPVANVEGEYDFKIYGNAMKSLGSGADTSAEPGIVMVSVDTNGNGVPDDEWFELRGSAHDNALADFTIRYSRPSQTETSENIAWTSNDPDSPSGIITHNDFHTQSYWPGWIEGDVIEFSGTRLPGNARNDNGTWVLSPFDWGYADNRPDFVNVNGNMEPNPEAPGFNIDNAVDADGNSVRLTAIDFVKVYTAVNQICDFLGETSTEICGARDLHFVASLTDVKAAVEPLRLSGRTLVVTVGSAARAEVFNAAGQRVVVSDCGAGRTEIDLSALPAGIYVARAAGSAMTMALR